MTGRSDDFIDISRHESQLPAIAGVDLDLDIRSHLKVAVPILNIH